MTYIDKILDEIKIIQYANRIPPMRFRGIELPWSQSKLLALAKIHQAYGDGQ